MYMYRCIMHHLYWVSEHLVLFILSTSTANIVAGHVNFLRYLPAFAMFWCERSTDILAQFSIVTSF